MNAQKAIESTLRLSAAVCEAYLEDLTDDEMMTRPADGCNHLKWQLGHLIASEHQMLAEAFPGSMPPLPAGFEQRYDREQCGNDDPAAFDSKEELMSVYRQQREATLDCLNSIEDAMLDHSAPERVVSYAPTLADVISSQGGHWLMHSGQWVVLRRKLGRPVLI